MKFNPFPWLLILAILAFCWGARIQLIEQNELAFFCDSGGQSPLCKLRWLIVRVFNNNGIDYFALLLGLLSAVTRTGFIGLWAGIIGGAGLNLHSWDSAGVEYAAVGFLLGVLTLARAQFDEYRTQHRTSQ